MVEARRHYVEPALARLPAGWPGRAPLRALDVGFGRGMNSAALLACVEQAGGRVEVLGFEPHPEPLEPWPRRPPRGAAFPWWGTLGGHWRLAGGSLEVRTERLEEGLREGDGRFGLVLLDLYSPATAPEDWSPALYAALAAHTSDRAVLASYCCARSVRDGLERSGWAVEVLRRSGVRDTLCAVRTALPARGDDRLEDEVRR